MAGISTNSHDEDHEEELDPRIKIELESLNQTAADVNRLEKEINEARSKYQETFYESSKALETLRKKHGSKIKKARPYYETKELAKEAQSEAMLSARKYQSANGVYKAAKETISLAEMRLTDDKAASLSPAWQEMLNHALIRVMESEQEKTQSEKEHLEKSAIFSTMEKKLHILQKKHKNAIAKSKPYFDAKNELELKLQQIKQSIEDMQQAMLTAKSQYSQSLNNLEEISDGIHEARRHELILMYPREPGVGAEEDTQLLHQEFLPLATTDFDLDSSDISKGKDSDKDDDDDDDDVDSNFDEPIDENTMCYCSTSQATFVSSESHFSNENNITLEEHEQYDGIRSDTSTNLPQVRVVTLNNKPNLLRKSISLPAYVEQDQVVENVRTHDLGTEGVFIKFETGDINVTLNTCHIDDSGPH